MTEKLKIINIPRRFVKEEWGGTETVILETCRRLKRLGNDVRIFTTNALSDRACEKIDDIEIRRFAYFYPYLGLTEEIIEKLDKKGGNLFSLPLFMALLKEKNVNLIHLHTGKRLGGLAARAAWLKKIPYVISLHGGLLDVPVAEAATWTEPTRDCFEWGRILGALVGSRDVIKNASAVICVNQDEVRKVKDAGLNQRVVYLPNGVDTGKFSIKPPLGFRKRLGISDNSFVALTCGRIDPQKNQLFLLQNLPEMLKICPELHLVFIGPTTNPDYEKKIREFLASEPFKSRVHLAGSRPPGHPDLNAAYHESDLFILPSLHEPFGIVILEAWASSMPVLASKTGGIPSFVEHRRDGLLFEPGSTASLMENFRAICSEKKLRRELAENGRIKSEKEFDWQIIAEKLENLYREIL
ncbi:MAG: glycosyltransferase family 4 protein [Candidatus Rifleibacteriota bacterium]